MSSSPYMRTTLIQAFAVTVMDDSRREGKTPVDPQHPRAELPAIGDLVGEHYRLVRMLGEGSFGKVYVAQRIDVPEHQVALKILPRSVYEGRNVERELVMLATVGHPHVVQLKDHGTGPDYVWLTMPVYEGETLAERLDRGTLTLREAHDIFVPVARGLEALHAAGLRHQDIKPENIYLAMFGARLHPILLDLGVAAEREASFVAGTMIYGAPEQIAAFGGNPGKIPLTERMDTYGLGTTLLIALTGASGFPGANAASPEEMAAAQEVRATRPLGKGVLPGLTGRPREMLDAALQRWLALDPKERPSMSELASELEVLLESEREEARAEERRRLRQKTSLIRIRMTALAMLVASVSGAYYMYSKRAALALAGELERARKEGAASFDKLDTCIASHKMEQSTVAACKAAREKDRTELRATLDAMKQVGSTSEMEHGRQIANLEALYSGRLKACEEAALSAEKAAAGEKSRLTEAWEVERAQLEAERDVQKKLAEERAAEIEALTGQRDRCETGKSACVAERDACKAAAAAATVVAAASTTTTTTTPTGPAPPQAGTGAVPVTTGGPAVPAPPSPPQAPQPSTGPGSTPQMMPPPLPGDTAHP